MKTTTSRLTKLTYTTAVALAIFSGGVSTYGLTKFAPGAEAVIARWACSSKPAKVVSFSLMHKQMPDALKGGLLIVGLVLMTLNIVA